MTTSPLDQVEAMPATGYFAVAAELMKVHPPHLTDFSVLNRIARIGLRPGDSFDPPIRPRMPFTRSSSPTPTARR